MLISGLFTAWKQGSQGCWLSSPLFFNKAGDVPAMALLPFCDCHSPQASSSNCEPQKLQGCDFTCWRLPVCCVRIIGPWDRGSICRWLGELCRLMSGREIISSCESTVCLKLSWKSLSQKHSHTNIYKWLAFCSIIPVLYFPTLVPMVPIYLWYQYQNTEVAITLICSPL